MYWANQKNNKILNSPEVYDIKRLKERGIENSLNKEGIAESPQTQQNLLEAVFESMAEGVVVADLDGKFHVYNAAARRMIGKEAVDSDPEQWPSIYGAFHPDTKTPWTKDDLVLLKAIRGESSDNVEAFFRNPEIPEGTFVSVTGRPLIDENGDLSGGVIIFSDISERKKAEREREALIEDLERRNAELERFAYTISHDLKTPLVTIKGFLGLLKKDLDYGSADSVKTDMQQIGKAADVMNDLLEDLLELSRIGRVVNATEQVSLYRLAREAVDVMAGLLENSEVEITLDKNLPTVVGDPLRLLEVLQNLIENAIKFMGDQKNPRVNIGCRRDNESIVCYVQDNGVGIHEKYQERIFELFERLDQDVEGTGIGLALVKRIIDMHGGSIWVESEGEGKGSRFCFVLPEISNPV